MTPDDERIETAVAKMRADLEAYSAFGQSHGFAGRVPKAHRNCSVFVFKPDQEKEARHRRWKELAELRLAVRERFAISPGAFMTEDSEYVAVGLYITWQGHPCWSIPNAFPETQVFVRERLPAWAEELKRP